MSTDKDWKAEYKSIIRELEDKEIEWQNQDSLLRKTISRLSIASRGYDPSLDTQLKLIQTITRDKKDAELTDALEQLSRVVATLDDSTASTAIRGQTQPESANASAVLQSLLQEITFKDNQRSELESISADLLDLLINGQNDPDIKPQIEKLAALINSNFTETPSGPPQRRATDRETQGTSVDEIMTTLMEKLAVVQGAADAMQLIQTEMIDKVDDDDWPNTLNKIVDCISTSLSKLNREKQELEEFIIRVTQQLGKISDVISIDQKDLQTDHDERDMLQQLMRESMKAIEADLDNAGEIGPLKNIVTNNLMQIHKGIETFVNRANRRQAVIDKRNGHLVAQITDMNLETRELKKILAENRKKLLFDTLTGAGSRLSYDETLEQDLARWDRYGDSFSYAILDIDHFKKINDQYGHNAGDKALKIVAKMMIRQIRKSDAIFRIGGEEFVLVLPKTSIAKASTLVEKLRKKIASSSIHCKQEPVTLTLSAGLTEPKENDCVKSIYERADKALYKAKHSGRNCQFIG